MQRLQPGTTVAGRYTVTGLLGSGGTASVYRARDTVMDRTVAIKVIGCDVEDPRLSARAFLTEIRAAAVLSHPNIVNVYDVVECGSEKYIVMEYVCGITLRAYLDYHGHLSVKESLNCTRQVLHALHAAHSRGIVHRDIKPGNILITTEGRIKVADFGIARLPGRDAFRMPDRTVGTAQYISPEQARGGVADERSDLYSLGILLYEMLTGKRPFEGESPTEVAMMQVSTRPTPPTYLMPSIPGEVQRIVMCALEKDPAARFDSAAAMLRVLDKLPQGIYTGHTLPHIEGTYRETTEAHEESTGGIPTVRQNRRRMPEGRGAQEPVELVEDAEAISPRPTPTESKPTPSPQKTSAAPPRAVASQRPTPPKAEPMPKPIPPTEASPVGAGSPLDRFSAEDTVDIMLSPIDPEPMPTEKGGGVIERVEIPASPEPPKSEAPWQWQEEAPLSSEAGAPTASEPRFSEAARGQEPTADTEPKEAEETPEESEWRRRLRRAGDRIFRDGNRFYRIFALSAAGLLALILLISVIRGMLDRPDEPDGQAAIDSAASVLRCEDFEPYAD